MKSEMSLTQPKLYRKQITDPSGLWYKCTQNMSANNQQQIV